MWLEGLLQVGLQAAARLLHLQAQAPALVYLALLAAVASVAQRLGLLLCLLTHPVLHQLLLHRCKPHQPPSLPLLLLLPRCPLSRSHHSRPKHPHPFWSPGACL